MRFRYSVAYHSASPEAAAAVVNAVIEEYMRIYTDENGQGRRTFVKVLEQERARWRVKRKRIKTPFVRFVCCGDRKGSFQS